MSEVCSDNRFELIGEFKSKLVEGTNIEMSPEEMAVLDNILFRIWQMGWLDKLKTQEPITGETSDGYHTFNELYHHRAVLFSVIVANYKDRAWKSVRHHDGTMYDGMFIIGIDTPDGQATYHYDIDPYWDMFDCKVCEFAPEWDGHTPAQAIERISKLKAQEPVIHGQWSEKRWMTDDDWGVINHRAIVCSVCKREIADGKQTRYCPNCGAKMDKEK